MGESRTPRPEPFVRDQLRACPMLCRQPAGLPSAGSLTVQSRVPRSGLLSDYATVAGAAPSLNDASTAREDEAASTLTLAAYAARARAGWRLPVTSICRLFTRPDGTSARVPRQPDPVETTHPQGSTSLSVRVLYSNARSIVKGRLSRRRRPWCARRSQCHCDHGPSRRVEPHSERGQTRLAS